MKTDLEISIDIATKVVDNYGDAGVALRLVRSLVSIGRELSVRLFIDDPAVLSRLAGGNWKFSGPGTELLLREDDGSAVRDLSVSVYDWLEMPQAMNDSRPDLLIEMFGGGLPEAYLAALYGGRGPRPVRTLWLNLEYLTAEDWAGDYHLTPSYSPDPNLDKFFFMPGFREGLGGLIIDGAFSRLKSTWRGFSPEEKRAGRRALLDRWGFGGGRNIEGDLWISVFSYEKDWSALTDFLEEEEHVALLLSPGKGTSLLRKEMEEKGMGGKCLDLPFFSQREWDNMLLSCDINLVRGEESLSRAALSGSPFLWQAYPIADETHMEKVEALCDLLCPERDDLKELFIRYNRNGGGENFSLLIKGGDPVRKLYENFAKNLEKIGNCTDQLILFFDNYIRLSAARKNLD